MYHLILSQRTTTYLVKNKLIDPEVQKAFLPGINGCIEHNIAMEELIKDARVKKRTLHITFFDLQDAFGSVPHQLIQHTLERNHFPQQIQDYMKRHYENTKSIVSTPSFQSEVFSFKRGVMQGCPYSPIIFLLAFNPIIQFLTSKINFGYNLHLNNEDEDKRYITLPYADDFCLLTTHKKTHQNLINQINKNIQSMGMMLKPSRWRSFSISGGSAKVVDFYI